MIAVVAPFARASMDDAAYGLNIYSDSACTSAVGGDNTLSGYTMAQDLNDKHCYVYKGHSVKIQCGKDDTVTIEHWFDLNGNDKPCSGEKMPGGPLMKEVPWEVAVGFFSGACTWSTQRGAYGKLSMALPNDGFPKCHFTGASIRRLSSHGNNTATTVAPSATTLAPTNAPPGVASGAVMIKTGIALLTVSMLASRFVL